MNTLLILLAFLLTFPVQAIAIAEGQGSTRPALQDIEPAITARGAIVVDLTDGLELYGFNADTPLPPASTVKVLTSLVALQLFERDEVIEITEADMLDEEFSQAGLMPGDLATVETLLYGVLIPSGADAALALARVGGDRLDPGTEDPVGRFVAEMNAVADSLGMEDSNFGNPVGFDDPDTYASARDLVRAAVPVLSDPLLSRIVATPWTTISVDGPNARDIDIENSNAFVIHDGAIGVKTGTEDEAGQCLINAYYYGDHKVVSVVLGSEDRYADTGTILAELESQVRWVRLGGEAPSLGATDELADQGLWMPVSRTLTLTPAEADALRYEVELSEDSEGDSSSAGVVSFYVENELVSRLPVYSNETIPVE